MSERWLPMTTAPTAPRAKGWAAGPLVYLLIPYEPLSWDVGYWSVHERCWRYTGDDGPDDLVPIGWAPLPDPPEPQP